MNGNIINDMEKYYAKRALEYENIYSRPERQDCIKDSKKLLRKYFEKMNVLEIACGTGYWTEVISEVSSSIIATDINNEVLDVAKTKEYKCKIDFILDDSYKLDKITEKMDSLFAGFWFSHIPKSKINDFLGIIHKKLNKNAIIVFIDNLYIEGNSTPISRYDIEGNSYQIRKLKDNSQHEVLKNFYNDKSLKDIFNNYGIEFEINILEYFWIIKYTKK